MIIRKVVKNAFDVSLILQYFYSDVIPALAHGLTAWCKEGQTAHIPQLSGTGKLNLFALQAWDATPDSAEGQTGKVAAPAHCEWYRQKQGGDTVAPDLRLSEHLQDNKTIC